MSNVPLTAIVIMSKTRAAALVSNFPVTGLIPSGMTKRFAIGSPVIFYLRSGINRIFQAALLGYGTLQSFSDNLHKIECAPGILVQDNPFNGDIFLESKRHNCMIKHDRLLKLRSRQLRPPDRRRFSKNLIPRSNE
jgi:hypothetical protein